MTKSLHFVYLVKTFAQFFFTYAIFKGLEEPVRYKKGMQEKSDHHLSEYLL